MDSRLARQIAAVIQSPIHEYIVFRGGLDEKTPRIAVDPGRARYSQNWYVDINGGYSTMKGYERYDGQAAPSDAQYAILDVTITGEFSVDDTITGVTSSATAVVLAVVTTTTPNYLVITKISGAFQDAEDLKVSGSKEGETASTAVVDGASTLKLGAQYNNLAADEYRADIAAVPGSGDILGGFTYNDVHYALRNNAGGTAAVLHKSSGSGWTALALGLELAFTSGGTNAPAEGETVTGLSSGAEATLTRIVLESGSWAGGDAAGRFIFATQTGTFQSENVEFDSSSTDDATIAGDSSAITLAVNGRLETHQHNFGGEAGTKRVYGADGVNRGWEFDGTVFVPIDTGMTADAPTHVRVHKKQLFFSFAGSAQHSGLTTPYIWSPVFGANELAVGDDITGFSNEAGGQEGEGALAICSRNKVHILYGTSSADWTLVEYRDELGAYEWSIQQIGSTLVLDDRGVRNLVSSERYGNFITNTLSRHIQDWIVEHRGLVVGSCISRDLSQYRLFFSDNRALYITVDGESILGMMPQLLANTPTCAWSAEMSNGNEVVFFGDDAGFVYQMEKGTSFDGDEIEHRLEMQFAHLGTPRMDKEFYGGIVEVEGNGYAEFTFSYELGYADPDKPQPGPASKTLDLSDQARWDTFTWDAAIWDTRALTPSEFELEGQAENISLILRGLSDEHTQIKVNGALIRHALRVPLR